MRTNNSLKNIKFGLVGQIMSFIMSFAVRTIFIKELGKEYLGLMGLFSNILLVLSLTDLGFNNAIIYSLYKPLAQDNKEKICSIVRLFSKISKLIGSLILILGLLLTPFLSYIVDVDIPIKYVSIIFILYLLDSSLTYFWGYKKAVTYADQKNYINVRIIYSYKFISNIFQIIFLIWTKSFIVFLVLQIIFNLLQNLTISNYVKKNYKYLSVKNVKNNFQEKKEIFLNTRSVLAYRIGEVIINGTDNIMISIFLSTGLVGVYSNYLLVLSSINAIIVQIFGAITASVGNLNALGEKKKSLEIYKIMSFMSFWIYGLTSICLIIVLNPFISAWLGNNYLFRERVVFLIVLNFYIYGMMKNVSEIFINTMGLFTYVRIFPLVGAIINIFFSIVLSKLIGITGIFLGTLICFLCSYFWVWPYVVFKKGLEISLKIYYKDYFKYFVLTIIVGIITFYFSSFIKVDRMIGVILKGILSFSMINLLFFMIFKNSKEFLILKGILISKLKRNNRELIKGE